MQDEPEGGGGGCPAVAEGYGGLPKALLSGKIKMEGVGGRGDC